MLADRTALMIIRAWVEEESPEPLRANIRLSTDVSTGFQRTLTLARPEAIKEAVDAWLQEIQTNERPPKSTG
jgi:hypothetical protein